MKIGPGAVSVLLPLVLLQYAVGGAFYPFLGPYLESAKGFEVRDLSLLALGAGVVNCVMPFVWGALADRVIAVNRLICLLHLSAAFSLLLFSRGAGLVMLTGLFALYTAQQQPTNSLSNALCYHNLEDPPKQFGPLRLWGSVGWALPSVPIAFWLLEGGERSLHFIIYLTFGLHLALALLFPLLPHTPPAGRREGAGSFLEDLKVLFRSPGFARLLLVTFLVQAGFAIMFYLSPLALGRSLVENDIRLGWLGPIQTCGVLLEIPLFLLLPRFLRRFGYRKVLGLGIAASVIRHLVFANSTSPLMLGLASQLCRARSFSLPVAACWRWRSWWVFDFRARGPAGKSVELETYSSRSSGSASASGSGFFSPRVAMYSLNCFSRALNPPPPSILMYSARESLLILPM